MPKPSTYNDSNEIDRTFTNTLATTIYIIILILNTSLHHEPLRHASSRDDRRKVTEENFLVLGQEIRWTYGPIGLCHRITPAVPVNPPLCSIVV